MYVCECVNESVFILIFLRFYPKPTSRHIITIKPITVPHVASIPFPLNAKEKKWKLNFEKIKLNKF